MVLPLSDFTLDCFQLREIEILIAHRQVQCALKDMTLCNVRQHNVGINNTYMEMCFSKQKEIEYLVGPAYCILGGNVSACSDAEHDPNLC